MGLGYVLVVKGQVSPPDRKQSRGSEEGFVRCRRKQYPTAVVFDPYCVLFSIDAQRASEGGGYG